MFGKIKEEIRRWSWHFNKESIDEQYEDQTSDCKKHIYI